MNVPIAPVMLPYIEPVLARLRYLHPNVQFELAGKAIEIACPPDTPTAEIQRDVQYALYREKIYAETLPLRRALIEAVTGK